MQPARQGPLPPGLRRLLEVADDVDDQVDRAGQVGLHGEASQRVAGQADHGVVGARLSHAEVDRRRLRREAGGAEPQVAG
jgi:hypothetical protein